MATKNYMINDKWLDINKKNIVELQSVDGVLDSVKLNGEEYGGGGGGSSDFSTAEVTIINNDNTFPCIFESAMIREESGSGGLHIDAGTVIQGDAGFGTNIHGVVLYKGGASAVILDPDGVETVGFDIEGDIEELGNSYFITGDCTITINPV